MMRVLYGCCALKKEKPGLNNSTDPRHVSSQPKRKEGKLEISSRVTVRAFNNPVSNLWVEGEVTSPRTSTWGSVSRRHDSEHKHRASLVSRPTDTILFNWPGISSGEKVFVPKNKTFLKKKKCLRKSFVCPVIVWSKKKVRRLFSRGFNKCTSTQGEIRCIRWNQVETGGNWRTQMKPTWPRIGEENGTQDLGWVSELVVTPPRHPIHPAHRRRGDR